jgi:hypothetical protein
MPPRAQEKKLTGPADQVHVRECFFLLYMPRPPRGDVIASIPYAKYQADQPFYFLCARKNSARCICMRAREKTLSFAYHRGKAIEIIIFYALTNAQARSEKISTRPEKKSLPWVTFSVRAITVALLRQCVSEIELFIV